MMLKIDYNKDKLDAVLIKLYLSDKPNIINSVKYLLENGYSEKGILYVLSKKEVQSKLEQYMSDGRLSTVFINEVRKLAFKNDRRK